MTEPASRHDHLDLLEPSDLRVAPAGLGLVLHLPAESRAGLLSLSGDLDAGTSSLLQALLEQALRSRRTPQVTRLLVDMSAVSFVDAAGLCPLLHARAVLLSRRGALEVLRPSSAARQTIALLALSRELCRPSPEPHPGPARR